MHVGEDTPAGGPPAGRTLWGVKSPVDPDGFNADLADGEPTVDIAVYYPDNLRPAHRRKVRLEAVLDGLAEAKRVFRRAGVQLAVVSVRTGSIDPSLLSVQAEAPGSELPGSRYANPYEERQERPVRMSDEARSVFETVIPDGPDRDRQIHIVILQDVFMSFYEQLDQRTWQRKTLATRAMSFPDYSYGEILPRRIRGAITLTDLSQPTSWKTIAQGLTIDFDP